MECAQQNPEESSPESLDGLLGHLMKATSGEQTISIGKLLKSLESRSHGPMLLLPALIAISPIGMIPGMSIVTGSLIVVIAVQMMLFSSRPWIPKRLEQLEFARTKLEATVKTVNPWVKRFEKLTGKRLESLTTGVMLFPIGLVCTLLAVTFYPLALVPFGVFVPALAVCSFALGITSRDGLLVLFGFVGTAIAVGIVCYAWPF